MLNDEALNNLSLIYHTARYVWGERCVFSEIRILNSPWSEFELPLNLYGKVDVGIYYDRSALDIGINQDGKFRLLSEYTSESVYRGMKAMIKNNLLHNFTILDQVVKRILESLN
jgi:hypothetical protein